MNQQLRTVRERAEKLWDAEQDVPAELLESGLKEVEWDESISRSSSKALNDRLRAELCDAEAKVEVKDVTWSIFE